MSAEAFPFDSLLQYGFAGFALFLMYRKMDELKTEIVRQTQVIIDKIAPQRVSAV